MAKTLYQKVSNNKYLLLLAKLVIFIFFVFVFDFAIGKTLKYFYFKQQSGLQYRTTYSLEQTKADLLVFGSSRANHHYYPEAFEQELNISFYNTGRDGSYILYQYAILQGILKRYHPKIIILDFMKKEFEKEQGSYDRLSALLPYYNTHPELRPIIRLKSKFENYKLLSQIYPYNSSLLTIAIGNTEYNKKRDNNTEGYIPLKNVWTAPITSTRETNYEFDSIKIDTYRKFINDCRNAGVQVFVVCSPTFEKNENPDKSIQLAKEIALENNVHFIDYSNNPVFFNNQFFADADHLNNEGAIEFSKMLVDELKPMLQPK